MARTLTTSEFAQVIMTRFAEIVRTQEVIIYNEVGNYAIYVKEMESGFSKVVINDASYGKMNADEKRKAVEYVSTIKIEKVTTKTSYPSINYDSYYIEGAYENKMNSTKLSDWQKDFMKEKLISIEPMNI